MINPPWLELPMSWTNFHGPKDVRAIEVRLYVPVKILIRLHERAGRSESLPGAHVLRYVFSDVEARIFCWRLCWISGHSIRLLSVLRLSMVKILIHAIKNMSIYIRWGFCQWKTTLIRNIVSFCCISYLTFNPWTSKVDSSIYESGQNPGFK